MLIREVIAPRSHRPAIVLGLVSCVLAMAHAALILSLVGGA